MLKLWSRRRISNQLPSVSTIRHQSRLSSAVPHKTAFFPPAFMAILPPIQLASSDVGSTAKTKPLRSAASETLFVTTPASLKMVPTSLSLPGILTNSTASNFSNFSVLITADIGVKGIAPPVYPVPPPRGMMVKPSSIHPFTMAGISNSVSGVITTKGYSTRQSVASVTCETLTKPSNPILSWAVTLPRTRFT